jgi:hypothetical protein
MERESCDEERHGEADPTEERKTEHLAPGHPRGKRSEAEPHREPRRAAHSDRFSKDEPGSDPQGRSVPEDLAGAGFEHHTGVRQRENRHDERAHPRVQRALEHLQRRLRKPAGPFYLVDRLRQLRVGEDLMLVVRTAIDILQPFARAGAEVTGADAGSRRNRDRCQHAGDRGMHPGLEE